MEWFLVVVLWVCAYVEDGAEQEGCCSKKKHTHPVQRHELVGKAHMRVNSVVNSVVDSVKLTNSVAIET